MTSGPRLLLVLLLLAPLPELQAQEQTPKRALDLSAGAGIGLGGPDVPNRGMLATSALLSQPVGTLERGTWLVAAQALRTSYGAPPTASRRPPLRCRAARAIQATSRWAY